jgi:hypothetical protein
MVDVLASTNNFKDAQAMLEGLAKPSENAKRLYPRILFGRAAEMINDGQLGGCRRITRIKYWQIQIMVLFVLSPISGKVRSGIAITN